MTSAVIIGGGVIGLGVAWRAAQRGLRVTVADPAPGRGAGYVAAGLLNPVGEAGHAEDALVRLGLESLARYPSFVAELTGRDAGLRMTGTLDVGFGPADLAGLGQLRARRESLDLPARELTGAQCRELEPMLDRRCAAGCWWTTTAPSTLDCSPRRCWPRWTGPGCG